MDSMIRLAIILALLLEAPQEAFTQAPPNPKAEPLRVLISVEQKAIVAPLPARITLHIHNAGRDPLWLYRHARSQAAIRRIATAQVAAEEEASRQSNRSSGGSTLEVQLEPEASPQMSAPAQGGILESAGIPHPRLVRLGPGDDYEEKEVVRLSPALAGSGQDAKPVWGRYRFSTIYGAKYSNADDINRILGLTVWQGEVSSNTLELELLPPPASARGSVAGSVVGTEGRGVPGVLVTLSDEQGHALNQVLSEAQGRFSFTHLPLGLYWTTSRRASSSVDTAIVRHVELTAAEPAAALQVVMLPPETYEPKQMLHKPVLFRITNSAGAPSPGVGVEVTWSSGTVLDNVRSTTSEDGTAALELIPGRNFMTLKPRGCKKEEQRADVADGDGIDGFKFSLECK